MSYNIEGRIISISEKQIFPSGSGKITFRIDTGSDYDNVIEFENFKSSDKIGYLDSFIKYNKVGDLVSVEFNIGANLWTNPDTGVESCFTKLKFWKIEQLEGETQKFEAEKEAKLVDTVTDEHELPF